VTGEIFDEEKMLSLEDLIEKLHHKINNLHSDVDETFSEFIRRDEIKDEYYEALLGIEKPTTRRVLGVLRESSGAHRFTDIRLFVSCSPTGP